MMHSVAMSVGDSALRRADGQGEKSQPAVRFVRLSQLRKLRDCEQVAAVCYRVRGHDIEFLLVRTRGSGRWTFPKGHAENGMSHAQAAAVEAFEEAGVHGRIEEASFARYAGRRRMVNSHARSSGKNLMVNAYLCEVLRLSSPKESNRKRTWFSIEDARQRLREGRESEEASAYARVVGRAVDRIKKLRWAVFADGHAKYDFRLDAQPRDELQKVKFEASPLASQMSYRQAVENRRLSGPYAYGEPGKPLECEVLQFATPQESTRNPEWFGGRKKPKALSAGAGS